MTFPDPSFISRLHLQLFTCPHASNGCLFQALYLDLLEHDKFCDFAHLQCLAYRDCRSTVLRKDIQIHQANCRYLRLETPNDEQLPTQSVKMPTREECEQLRRESQEKEVLIQNLMEKINYLQRRVVFLENELAEAGQSDDDQKTEAFNSK